MVASTRFVVLAGTPVVAGIGGAGGCAAKSISCVAGAIAFTKKAAAIIGAGGVSIARIAGAFVNVCAIQAIAIKSLFAFASEPRCGVDTISVGMAIVNWVFGITFIDV